MNPKRRLTLLALCLTAALAAALPACARPATVDLPSHSSGVPTSSSSAAPFRSSIARITQEQAGWMTGRSWHEGCPVPISALRVVSLSYYDFDGAVAQGRLVVNRKVAGDIVAVFGQLFAAKFPIMHMDATDIDPPGSLAGPVHDDTVVFNCRVVPGTQVWSQHAYGLAVDINPVQNPWVKGDRVLPRAGKTYLDRSQTLPGMVHEGDAVVQAFAGIGWSWGGDWRSLKDYMHFSLTGG